MKKQTKRPVIMLIALLLGVSMLKTNVYAFNENACNVLLGAKVIYSATGVTAVSEEIREDLEQRGIALNDLTKVQIIADFSDSRTVGGNALVLTNVDNDVVTKDILLLFDDEGLIPFETTSVNGSRASEQISFPANAASRTYYVVVGRATYDSYRSTPYSAPDYIRPLQVSFSYEKLKTCTISNITVDFNTTGSECSYPTFGDSDQLVRWEITASHSNLEPYVTYSRTNNYPSNKVIYMGGNPLAGCGLTFSVTVNGKTEGFTFPLSISP